MSVVTRTARTLAALRLLAGTGCDILFQVHGDGARREWGRDGAAAGARAPPAAGVRRRGGPRICGRSGRSERRYLRQGQTSRFSRGGPEDLESHAAPIATLLPSPPSDRRAPPRRLRLAVVHPHCHFEGRPGIGPPYLASGSALLRRLGFKGAPWISASFFLGAFVLPGRNIPLSGLRLDRRRGGLVRDLVPGEGEPARLGAAGSEAGRGDDAAPATG